MTFRYLKQVCRQMTCTLTQSFRKLSMRQFLAPLIGIPLGLAMAGLAAAWAGPALPRLDLPRAAALPQVLPFPHDPMRAPPGAVAQASGTGFFAASHTVLTAAHVVSDCRMIRLVSRHLPPTEARLVAVDDEHDIAVLHAAAAAPAHLGIAADDRAPGRVLVHGFPAGSGRDVPATTWASLVNDTIASATLLERDPRTLVWLQNRDIAQGYSGGPILDPANGRVVGIVRALIDPKRAAAAYGIATPDLSIGTGAMPLRAALGDSAKGAGVAEDEGAIGDDIFTRARKATVHVFCWQ